MQSQPVENMRIAKPAKKKVAMDAVHERRTSDHMHGATSTCQEDVPPVLYISRLVPSKQRETLAVAAAAMAAAAMAAAAMKMNGTGNSVAHAGLALDVCRLLIYVCICAHSLKGQVVVGYTAQ